MTKLQSHERETFEPVERAPEAQAEGFATVRQAHESEMAEDYVELIAELIETRGEARPVDISERLGVKPPTVTKNISRLRTAGLVRRERYRAVFLTERGQALAEACRRRHRIVVAFLLTLGVDEETAERDAEGIEHHVSDETLAAFERKLDQTNQSCTALRPALTGGRFCEGTCAPKDLSAQKELQVNLVSGWFE